MTPHHHGSQLNNGSLTSQRITAMQANRVSWSNAELTIIIEEVRSLTKRHPLAVGYQSDQNDTGHARELQQRLTDIADYCVVVIHAIPTGTPPDTLTVTPPKTEHLAPVTPPITQHAEIRYTCSACGIALTPCHHWPLTRVIPYIHT